MLFQRGFLSPTRLQTIPQNMIMNEIGLIMSPKEQDDVIKPETDISYDME